MPYLDASPADLQRSFDIANGDLPNAAVIIGRLGVRRYVPYLREIWPEARELTEQIWVVETDGQRTWFVSTFGAAMAATFAHLAARLGARAMVQVGTMGGLQPGWRVGQILVPDAVIGRDGVSRQLSRNRPILPDRVLSDAVADGLAADGQEVRRGSLVTTTTIAFERTSDLARWRRAGYAGVEMEAAATLAVAAHFGIPAAAALVLIDNLAENHTVFHVTDDDRRRVRAARRSMEAVIPALLAELTAAVP